MFVFFSNRFKEIDRHHNKQGRGEEKKTEEGE